MTAPTNPQQSAATSKKENYLIFCHENNLKPCYFSSLKAYKNA
jgi:hypothetical protein